MTAETDAEDLGRDETLRVALAKCSPSQRQWLSSIPTSNWRVWSAASRLGISSATIHEWLQQSHVREARRLLEQFALAEVGATAARITRELARIAFFDIRDVFTSEGGLRPLDQWGDEAAAAIQSIDIETRYEGRGGAREPVTVTRIRLHPKLEALQTLARITKMLVTRAELTGTGGQPFVSGCLVVPSVVTEEVWAEILAKQQADLADRERAADGLS